MRKNISHTNALGFCAFLVSLTDIQIPTIPCAGARNSLQAEHAPSKPLSGTDNGFACGACMHPRFSVQALLQGNETALWDFARLPCGDPFPS